MLELVLFLVGISTILSFRTDIKSTYESIYYHRTYIKYIDTPNYGEDTKIILENFNKLGDNQIVKYNGTRPITIEEMSLGDELLYPGTLGFAVIYPTHCEIKLRTGAKLLEYKETVLHEYLHCFGYEHINDENDLMNPYETFIDKEENIRYYARDLKERVYEPRFYRF